MAKATLSVRPEDVHLTAPGARRSVRHRHLRARSRRHDRDLCRCRRPPDHRGLDAARAAGRDASASRSASCFRRRSAWCCPDETRSAAETRRLCAAVFPGDDADRLLRRSLCDDDRRVVLPAPAGRLLRRRPSCCRNYERFLSWFFANVLGFSLMLAVVVAICCVVLALPFTYLLTRMTRKVQIVWLVALLVGAVAVGSDHRLCLVDAVFAHGGHHQPARHGRAHERGRRRCCRASARC